MAKYGRSASKNVASAMRRKKKGTLKSGSGRAVKSRKQAIAIGLSEAREKGAKVPSRKTSSRKSSGRKTSSRKSSTRKSSARKSSARKSSRKGSRKTSGGRAAKKR